MGGATPQPIRQPHWAGSSEGCSIGWLESLQCQDTRDCPGNLQASTVGCCSASTQGQHINTALFVLKHSRIGRLAQTSSTALPARPTFTWQLLTRRPPLYPPECNSTPISADCPMCQCCRHTGGSSMAPAVPNTNMTHTAVTCLPGCPAAERMMASAHEFGAYAAKHPSPTANAPAVLLGRLRQATGTTVICCCYSSQTKPRLGCPAGCRHHKM